MKPSSVRQQQLLIRTKLGEITVAGNTSSAVRQQRRKKSAPRELDYFPTPPFATRTFCEWLAEFGYQTYFDVSYTQQLDVWEPACGEMHMSKALSEFFANVRTSDVHKYNDVHELMDFPLLGRFEPDCTDWVITNPPFTLAEEFIEAGLIAARKGVAMLVRTAFLEGQGRFHDLFNVNPPTYILQHTERVLMLENRLIKSGDIDPCTNKPVSTATAYCWLVWLVDDEHEKTIFEWLPPSRSMLERPDDYPVYNSDEFEPAPTPLLEGDKKS